MKRVAIWLCGVLAAVFLVAVEAGSQQVPKRGLKQAPKQAVKLDPKRSTYETTLFKKLNEAAIGIAAGQLEGAPLRFATELGRVVDDGDKLRILPIVTRGPFENVHDLLYVRGVDAAIINGDVFEHFKKEGKIESIDKRVLFITHLFPSEVHVFVRPEITSLEDLAGKPVNFNTQGTAAAYSGPIIFERLGIKVDPHFVPHPVAMAEMANSSKYAAVVFVSAKPLDPFLKRKWQEGFRFLPVPLTEKLEEYYLPATLEAADYPGLIPAGASIQTIAVPAVLAVYAWPQGTERYAALTRFVNRIFERLPVLQTEPGYHAKWREMNLAATVPGWQRFRPVQDKLAAVAAAKFDPKADGGVALKQAIARLAPGDTVEQNRLLARYFAPDRPETRRKATLNPNPRLKANPKLKQSRR
jgi:TRAP-type uncharacterized transport system substrate-binding protein